MTDSVNSEEGGGRRERREAREKREEGGEGGEKRQSDLEHATSLASNPGPFLHMRARKKGGPG